MDVNQIAARVVEISTGEPIRPQEKNAAAVSLGRLGGLKGGRARADKLTPEERSGIAQRAAKQRWAKEKVRCGGTWLIGLWTPSFSGWGSAGKIRCLRQIITKYLRQIISKTTSGVNAE
jgi:hypothetical protein